MDQTQVVVIEVVMMTGSTLSFIGCALMLRSLWKKNPWFKNARVDEKILGTMAFVAFIRSISLFQNRFFVVTQGLCNFLGFINQWSGITEMMLNMFLSLNFWLMLLRNGSTDDHTTFYIFLTISLGLPLIGATLALSMDAYGDAITVCWIVNAKSDLRIILYFVPLWTCLLLSILLNGLGVYHVYEYERKLFNSNDLTRVASKSFVYCSMFVIIWIIPTAGRLYESIHGTLPFWLVTTGAFCATLNGFLTSSGYFMLQYMKNNEAFKGRPSGFIIQISLN